MDFIKEWLSEYPLVLRIIKYVILVIGILILIKGFRNYIKRRIPEVSVRYKLQKGIEIIGYFFIVGLAVFYFTGNMKDFTLAVGLFTAGVAFTLQELFLSIAGSIYIFLVSGIQAR